MFEEALRGGRGALQRRPISLRARRCAGAQGACVHGRAGSDRRASARPSRSGRAAGCRRQEGQAAQAEGLSGSARALSDRSGLYLFVALWRVRGSIQPRDSSGAASDKARKRRGEAAVRRAVQCPFGVRSRRRNDELRQARAERYGRGQLLSAGQGRAGFGSTSWGGEVMLALALAMLASTAAQKIVDTEIAPIVATSAYRPLVAQFAQCIAERD